MIIIISTSAINTCRSDDGQTLKFTYKNVLLVTTLWEKVQNILIENMVTPQSVSFGTMMGLIIAVCIGVGSTFSLKPGKQNYYLILIMLLLNFLLFIFLRNKSFKTEWRNNLFLIINYYLDF